MPMPNLPEPSTISKPHSETTLDSAGRCRESRRDMAGGGDYHGRTMLAAFLTTVLFAVSAVCGSRTARTLGGTEANFWRLVLATIALGVYGHSLGAGLSGAAFPLFLCSGSVGFGLGDVAFFQALPRLGARLTAMMVTCLSAPRRSEERRVGKECRSRWSPYH